MIPDDITPMDLSENPALGILIIVLAGLDLARLSLCAVHGEVLCEEDPALFSPHEAASLAYAMALLAQIGALQETIQGYRRTLLERRDTVARDDEDGTLVESVF